MLSTEHAGTKVLALWCLSIGLEAGGQLGVVRATMSYPRPLVACYLGRACEFMRLGWAPPFGVCIQRSALESSPSSSGQIKNIKTKNTFFANFPKFDQNFTDLVVFYRISARFEDVCEHFVKLCNKITNLARF